MLLVASTKLVERVLPYYSPKCVEKLFGKSEWVPNRVPEGHQEGTKRCRSAASLGHKRTLEKPPAISQTVSEGEFYEVEHPLETV